MFKINLLKTKTFWVAIVGLTVSVAGLNYTDMQIKELAEPLVMIAIIALRDGMGHTK